jgi:tetratricopeptide (TPR) repeat protein
VPNDAVAYEKRAIAKYKKTDVDGSILDFSKAIELKPDFEKAYKYRSIAESSKEDFDGAMADCTEAIQLQPDDVDAYLDRGDAEASKADYAGAIADYSKAIQLKPDDADAYNGAAWYLATSPQANLRDGKKAVEYATKACDLTAWKNFSDLDTLAAACAEAGDFDSAIKWETQYLLAPDLSAADAAKHQARLALYQAHQPYHTDK